MTQSHFPRRILLGILALTVGAVGISGCNRGATAPQQAVVPVNPGTQVSTTAAKTASISDTADVTGALISEQDVNVGVKMAGKVVAVYAREGDVIRAGQVVVQQDTTDLQNQVDQQRANLLSARTRLEQSQLVYKNAVTTLKWTEDQTQSAVHLAEAGLEAAKEQASIVKQGARPQERQQAEENLSAAKADRDKARADLKRYQDLYREQAISAQQLDQAQAIVDSADARYNGAAQALSLVKEGSRPEDIRRSQAAVEQAHQQVVSSQSNRDQVNLRRSDMVNARVGILSAEAGLRQAQAGLRLAEQAVKDATVRSPIDGIVAERKIEPGMQAGAGRDVMRIVSLNSIYFDAQLSESQYACGNGGQSLH